MAATKSVSAARLRDAPPGLASRLGGLRVLDAELRVRERLDACLLDRLAAPLAEAVGLGVHPFQGAIDLPQEVPHVVLDGEVLLALERGRASVRRLVVESHVAGHVRL